MKINIIAVGKIKEKYLREAVEEYQKRLSKFCKLSIIEINESIAKVENEANINDSVSRESRDIIGKIKSGYVVVLDINGIEYSTTEFSKKMQEVKLGGVSEISFIIGGSYGLSDEVKKMADLRVSFSKLTFPHQLFRVILLEQIYRIFKIENNEPYHK